MTGVAAVAVVGGGASGCLTAIQIARSAGRPVEITVVESAGIGAGLAYSTTDSRHRLNVPAKGMSAYPDDPEHFLRWLRRHVDVDFSPAGFAPRLHYASYLAQTLDEAVAAAGNVRVEQVRSRVTDLRRHGRRLRLTLADGTSRAADAAVLTMGHGAPSTSWAPDALRRSARFVADPWRAADIPEIPAGSDILLVGAGLTMADMALRWGRAGVRVHVASRHGLLPLPHATAPAVPAPPPSIPDGTDLTLGQVRHLVFDRLRAAGGDWRPAIDGMRPVTAELWFRMSDEARERFLITASRRWDRVRHRIDPALHAWLTARQADGSLIQHAAGVVTAVEDEGSLRIGLGDGVTLNVAAVFNCTGTCTALRVDEDPLVLNLLDSGTALPGPLDLGFATDARGRLEPGAGPPPAVWAVGPLRRGQLWESTAIPEIRQQAAEVARDLVAALPSTRIRRRPRDQYGLPLTASSAAAARYVEGLGRILRVQSGAEHLIGQAVAVDPQFALGHAVLALLGTEWSADIDVDSALAAAHRASRHADDRERRFIEVATERVRQPGAASAASLLAYLQTYPEDALAVSLTVPTIAFGGATEIPAEAWTLVENLAPAYGPHDWWHRGLLAFVRQDQGRYEEALALANLALTDEPAAGHAVHARAHVHYETGEHRAGLAWLDGWIASCGARASHRAHFSWHAALHELALGDDRAALVRYADQLAPPMASGVRALVDSVSLLWRGYVNGAWARADVASALATVPAGLLADPPTPFIAMHAAIALTASGDTAGLTLLRRRAASRAEPAFPQLVAPLADALEHLLRGDAAGATDGLLALRDIGRLGGSAAQREIIEETLILCAIRAGRPHLARSILHARCERRRSPRDLAALQALGVMST